MHPRNSIVKIFSTFLQFDADSFSGWATDARLRRSIQNCIDKNSQIANGSDELAEQENFWANYWYRIWQKNSARLAKSHLSAYLQETCYWIAHRTVQSFASSQYKLSDCFQVAIASVDKVLKGFNPERSSGFKAYAKAIFSSAIRDTLRQRHEVDICSTWGLLRKVSQKRLSESLINSGLSPEVVNNHIMAWNSFKKLYVPQPGKPTRQLQKPDPETLKAIAEDYNSQIQFLQIKASQTQSQIDPQTLENWLLRCAVSVRNYLYPNITSANTPTGEGDTTEYLDYIPDERDLFISQMIDKEEEENRKYQQSEVSGVLKAAIEGLNQQTQEILVLYYSQGLTQQQIAQELQIKQYTISRRLTKAKEVLIRSLSQWSQENLHISVNSDLLKTNSTVIEEWLEQHYQQSRS
ncbi:sigma-70 family RNA polymerase sigma factor [Mastigocoleus sp. MO_188.B34]|uniref:sigma-70 family RNA polymerase sigma factor n=1 Tax=Mastigocoleus sp. MO_188.B34 TaxID=3036635 RepID=UPI002610CC91|nr:sigma-70 family RNA polymerase sigma factor [Mastigocoleus sp. MO_188.B34]MDJ0695571.1 sigma-70 family RNA polymerase sigma factor [Mastigocoleus sp. MO_188.B34]